MFEILSPSPDETLSLQRRESAYYFSRCAEAVLRKHGLIDVGPAPPGGREAGLLLATRATPLNGASLDGPCCLEGPVGEQTLLRLNLRGTARTATTLTLLDAERRELGRLAFPRFTVRRIPARRGEASEPYVYVADDPCWNNQAIRFQHFSPSPGWRPVAFARADETEDELLVGICDGARLLLGVPLFDLIGAGFAFPPLSVGYYSMAQGAETFGVEQWLVEELLRVAAASAVSCVRACRWPKGFTSAFSIRHDYDRALAAGVIGELLDEYDRRGIRSSWGFLTGNCDPAHARLVASRGHEVALHSVAATPEAFSREVLTLTDRAGVRPAGATAHGGLGAPGFLGQRQYLWGEASGLVYGEILGRGNRLPHPVVVVRSGMPEAGRLVIVPAHQSLDRDTRPEGHYLEYLQSALPRQLEAGEHVVLMNHPDIHVAQLKQLLDTLDLSSTWCATLHQVALWSDLAKFRSRVRRRDRQLCIDFDAPLPVDTVVEVVAGPHERRQFIVPAGSSRFTMELARWAPVAS